MGVRFISATRVGMVAVVMLLAGGASRHADTQVGRLAGRQARVHARTHNARTRNKHVNVTHARVPSVYCLEDSGVTDGCNVLAWRQQPCHG